MAAPASADASPGPEQPLPGARAALVLLLGINLFNYVDRQVLAAVEPLIRHHFGATQAQMGWLATAFLVSYMIFSPVFGWLGDRTSRWLLVAAGVTVWSLATGATGLATSLGILLVTRCFVGIGEAAYGPVAPTILSDLYPVAVRGKVMAWLYLAIPVGSALGYVLGGGVAKLTDSWNWPFYVVVLPGIALGVWASFMKDPRRGSADRAAAAARPGWSASARFRDYLTLLRTPSYVLDSLGMTAMTFAIGGIGFWMPSYLYEHKGHGQVDLGKINLIFGGITVVSGFAATLLGGMAGDALRKRTGGSYFLVSGAAILAGFPMLVGVLLAPLPFTWVFVFLAVFCLFFNTGPTNTILANVTHPSVRATAFALNIFLIHALGDAISPPLMGWIADRSSMTVSFGVVGVMFLLAGVFWIWGARYLARDTAAVPDSSEQLADIA